MLNNNIDCKNNEIYKSPLIFKYLYKKKKKKKKKKK